MLRAEYYEDPYRNNYTTNDPWDKDREWDKIPDKAPEGAKYGWYDPNDDHWETVQYERIDGQKIELNQVTDTKYEPFKKTNLIFAGFVTRFLRGAESDRYLFDAIDAMSPLDDEEIDYELDYPDDEY